MTLNSILYFFKLIRWQNLIIIAFTQYLMRYCVIEPLMYSLGQNAGMMFILRMSNIQFFSLVLSTVLIAAAGNIINDYFDLKIDRINKPEEIIVGSHIKRRWVMAMHIVFNAVGIILGGYVAYSIGMWKLGLIHLFAAMSLWYYSTHFKYNLFTGNFIVALLTALVPLIVGLFEIPLINYRYGMVLNEFRVSFNFIAYWIIAYSIFAFLFTLAREITKDIADMEGDEYYSSYTIPVAYGVHAARYICIGIYAIAFLLIGAAWYRFLADNTTLIYILFLIGIPLVITVYKTIRAHDRDQFISAGNWNKITSVAGILYALVARHIILNGPLF